MRLPFKPLLLTGMLLAAPLFSACHGNVGTDEKGSKVEFSMKNGSLTLRRQIVIVKVSGHDPAYVTTHGHLVIGNSDAGDVPTNEAQRAALVAYNRAANEMINKGVDVGVEGAHVAADAIGIVIKDAVNGKTQDIDKDVKKGVQPIKTKVDALCDQLDTWRQRQNDVAKLIPVFQPYAIINDDDIKDCHDHGFHDDDDSADDNDDKDADKDSDDDDDKDQPADSASDAAKSDSRQPAPPTAPSATTPPAEPKPPAAPTPPPVKGSSGGSTKKSLTV